MSNMEGVLEPSDTDVICLAGYFYTDKEKSIDSFIYQEDLKKILRSPLHGKKNVVDSVTNECTILLVSEPNENHRGTKEDGTKYRYRKIVRNTNALDSNPQDENEISKVGTKKYEAAIKKGIPILQGDEVLKFIEKCISLENTTFEPKNNTYLDQYMPLVKTVSNNDDLNLEKMQNKLSNKQLDFLVKMKKKLKKEKKFDYLELFKMLALWLYQNKETKNDADEHQLASDVLKLFHDKMPFIVRFQDNHQIVTSLADYQKRNKEDKKSYQLYLDRRAIWKLVAKTVRKLKHDDENSKLATDENSNLAIVKYRFDMDDNKKLVDEFQTSEPIDLHELRKQIDKVKDDVVNIKDSSLDINALTSDIVDEERKFAMIAKFVIDEFPQMLRSLLKRKWDLMVESLPPGGDETKSKDVTQLSNEWEYVDRYGTKKSITITKWEDMNKKDLGMILLNGVATDAPDRPDTLKTFTFVDVENFEFNNKERDPYLDSDGKVVRDKNNNKVDWFKHVFEKSYGKYRQKSDRFTKQFKEIVYTPKTSNNQDMINGQTSADANKKVWKRDAKFKCKIKFIDNEREDVIREVEFDMNYKTIKPKQCLEWKPDKEYKKYDHVKKTDNVKKSVCIFFAKYDVPKDMKDFKDEKWNKRKVIDISTHTTDGKVREEIQNLKLPNYLKPDIKKIEGESYKITVNHLLKHPDADEDAAIQKKKKKTTEEIEEETRIKYELDYWNVYTFYVGIPIAEKDLYWNENTVYYPNDYLFQMCKSNDDLFTGAKAGKSYLYYTISGVSETASENSFKKQGWIRCPIEGKPTNIPEPTQFELQEAKLVYKVPSRIVYYRNNYVLARKKDFERLGNGDMTKVDAAPIFYTLTKKNSGEALKRFDGHFVHPKNDIETYNVLEKILDKLRNGFCHASSLTAVATELYTDEYKKLISKVGEICYDNSEWKSFEDWEKRQSSKVYYGFNGYETMLKKVSGDIKSHVTKEAEATRTHTTVMIEAFDKKLDTNLGAIKSEFMVIKSELKNVAEVGRLLNILLIAQTQEGDLPDDIQQNVNKIQNAPQHCDKLISCKTPKDINNLGIAGIKFNNPENSPDNIMSNIRLICNTTKLAYDPLTKDQKEYIDKYEKNKNQYKCVHIDGPAGSGKTFIALYIIVQTLLKLVKVTQEKCILVVCTKNSLAMFLARWILIRILSKDPILYTDNESKGESNNNMVDPAMILNCIHFCTKDIGATPKQLQFKILKHDVVGLEFVNITKAVSDYELFVVDEAHHMIVGEDPIWENIRGNYFFKAKQRVLLSDSSQNPVRMNDIELNINYMTRGDAKKLHKIQLKDVIRSTKRITMSSNLFRKRDEIVKCANDKYGDAVKFFVVKRDTESIIGLYVEETVNALKWACKKVCNEEESYQGLDNRVSIILPDNDPRTHKHFDNDTFKAQLQTRLDKFTIVKFKMVDAQAMFSTFPQLRKPDQPVQVVVDTISYQDGLEYDVAVLVGFERKLDEMKEKLEHDKSIIYRSITRAKQLVAIVFKQMDEGWFTSIYDGTTYDPDNNKLERERNTQVLLRGTEKRETINSPDMSGDGSVGESTHKEVPLLESEDLNSKVKHQLDKEASGRDVKKAQDDSTVELFDKKNKTQPQRLSQTYVREICKQVLKKYRETNESCDFFQKDLTDDDMPVIYKELYGMVKILSLNKNRITSEGLKTVSKFLKKQEETERNTAMTSLSLKDNNITDVQSIGKRLKENKTLEKLFLDRNKITDVQSIGDALTTNNALTILRLRGNNITAVQSIGDALKTNNALKILNLWINNITDVQSIGKALETNKTLIELNLSNNNITDVQSIGEALKDNTTLEKLFLGNNEIIDVQSIGKALETNKTLHTLTLDYNKITDDSGIQSIIDVLKINDTLFTLHLNDNRFSKNLYTKLKAIQQYKREGSNGYQQAQVKAMTIFKYSY
eukprot:g15362.t1